ncbi:hypothetical protein FDK21_18700 [Cohaesibacter sp. CAU 1516]|uniref:hypothetical protein n=1 Tax=Cohaesibacter sp. CAU 1516 TaxID=2576038 RepID=UPI0010FE5D49|nr:hypothetical protein [Cohaesibacter sp. CAU 1516]TLP43048.1 hypothetical protein FDK21_18700 [Cohaesibacter sp. CAU 1516]
MQGYQYAHIESYSRKGGQQKKRANGDRAWTVDEVIAEAERKPGSCSHVEEPDPDPLIIPGSCKNFDELRQAHHDACKVKQQVPYTIPKTGKKSVRTKALRVDKHTLYSSVISLPILSADAWAMPDLMNECMELFHQVVRFEKDRLEAADGQFAMAVVHRDEAHMHIHVYGVDPVRGEITWLHPGKAAVDNIRRGAGWKKDNVAEQDRAYCDAMRQWQDDFYTSVFRDAGLMRYGPKRFRLPRAEYLQQMDAHEQLALMRRDLPEARKTIDEAHSQQESIEAKRQELEKEKREFEEYVTTKECKLKIAEEELFERQDELYFEQRQKQAEGDQIIAKAEEAKREADAIRAEALQQKKQHIAKFESALDAGLAAVDDGVISYQPSSGAGQQDTLSFGPSAPKDDKKRAILKAKWQPALKVIKKYARRIWSSEAAQCERQFKADPSLVDVQVTYNPDAEPQSDDILKMDVKVSLDKIKGLSKPMQRILGGIANVIATQVGNAAIKLVRSKLRDEFDALKDYREQHRKQYGTVDPNAEAKMSFKEQGLENMMAKAPDPRNAERRERQDRRVKGDKMVR